MNAVVIAETLRRRVTSVGYIVGVVFLMLIAFAVAPYNQPGSMWPSLITLFAIVIGSGVIGPEFSRGTLQLILTKPINRSTYLLSRVTGAVLAIWIPVLLGGAAESIGRMVWSASRGIESVAMRALNTGISVILICALLVLLGSITRAYYNAAIYVGLMVGLGAGQGILGLMRKPQYARVLAVVEDNLFPDAPMIFARDWLLLVLSNAAIALVLACFAFRGREVPYGAD